MSVDVKDLLPLVQLTNTVIQLWQNVGVGADEVSALIAEAHAAGHPGLTKEQTDALLARTDAKHAAAAGVVAGMPDE
jgi:hypothetical protein